MAWTTELGVTKLDQMSSDERRTIAKEQGGYVIVNAVSEEMPIGTARKYGVALS